jgi:hypothetical protein
MDLSFMRLTGQGRLRENVHAWPPARLLRAVAAAAGG